ncbi:hypothetical protein ACA910_010284 [Epithemia clementina (nom. ined.)]
MLSPNVLDEDQSDNDCYNTKDALWYSEEEVYQMSMTFQQYPNLIQLLEDEITETEDDDEEEDDDATGSISYSSSSEPDWNNGKLVHHHYQHHPHAPRKLLLGVD